MSANDSIKRVLETAILAPSADNTQPWKVSVRGNSIDLFHVPERDISPYDSAQRGSLVAHGAFIENARIAAAAMDRSLQIFLDDANASNNWHVAQLVFRAEKDPDQRASFLYPYSKDRATNRKPYTRQKLTDSQKAELLQYAQTGLGRIKILDYPQPHLAQAVSVTEQISFQNEEVHKNLFKNIRWSVEEVNKTHDGFFIKTFELPLPAKILFRIAQSWQRLNFLNRSIGLARSIPKQTSKLYEQSAAFIGILGVAHSSRDFVEVGQLMQRLWLAATKLGISMQPVGALLFFKQGIDNKTTDVFSTEDKTLIREAYKKISGSFAPERGEQVLFIFRAGFTDPPSARTLRLPLSDILI